MLSVKKQKKSSILGGERSGSPMTPYGGRRPSMVTTHFNNLFLLLHFFSHPIKMFLKGEA